MNSVFEISTAQIYERLLIAKDLVDEPVEQFLQLSSEYYLINGKHIIEFGKNGVSKVGFYDVPQIIREQLLDESVN